MPHELIWFRLYLLLKPAILKLKAPHFLNVGGQPAIQLAQHLLLLSPAGIQESLNWSENCKLLLLHLILVGERGEGDL